MNSNDYVARLLNRPLCQSWGAVDATKRTALAGAVATAVGRISSAYDFLFTIGVETHIGGTVANQSTYTLKGDSSPAGGAVGGNARDIINIRYGTTRKLLDKIDKAEADRKYSEVTLPTSVDEWIMIGEVDFFPQIELIGTPLVSGVPILYRFRKKNIPPDAIPNDFAWVVMLLAEAELFQSTFDNNLERKAERAINSMIDDYDRGGGEESPAPIGEAILNQNRSRKIGGIG